MSQKRLLFMTVLAMIGMAGCEDIPSATRYYPPSNVGCSQEHPCLTGVCNMETGVCVECVQNSDCTYPDKPVCEPTKHVCVATCKDGSECPSGICEDHICREIYCDTDADCMHGVCDTANHLCVACRENSDCESGVCNVDRHSCVECLSDPDCTDETKPVCNTATNVCVECREDANCKDPSKPACQTDRNLCVQCNKDDDCESGICDLNSHLCRGCETHADCTNVSKPICNSETKDCEPCVANPESDNKCPEKDFLKPICLDSGEKAGQCVTCVTGSDCISGVCVDNMCKECDETHPCTAESEFCELTGENANTCVVCSDTVPCPNGLVCSAQGKCVECTTDSDCSGDKPACDVQNNICVECNSATQIDNCSTDKPICDDATHLCTVCIRTAGEEFNDACKQIDASRPVCLEDPNDSSKNKCVECDNVVSAAQCTTSETSPICQIRSDSENNNVCGPCKNNDECKAKEGALDLCNTTSGACVECLTVADCPEGMTFCEQNRCGNCHDNKDCPTNLCVDNICKECEKDADCTNPDRPVCALEGSKKNTCVPCNPATQDNDCKDKTRDDIKTPVCAVDTDDAYSHECYECNPDSDPYAPAIDCRDVKSEDGTNEPYCATAPSAKSHFCVECIPNPAEKDNGVDDSCLQVVKNGVLSQVCADERASEKVQNTCVECDDDAVKTQCNASLTSPICNIDAASENAYHCMPCDTTDSAKGNAQCAKKDASKPICVTVDGNYDAKAGSCVECIDSTDCASGSYCNTMNQCVECLDRSDDAQCTNPNAGVCCDAASLTAGHCTAKDATGAFKCEKCDIKTNCIGSVCNETTGKCEPCKSDDECVSVERGICVAGTCEKCEETGTAKNCSMVCSQTTGKCEPCVDDDTDPSKINCEKVCDFVMDTCEPCDNVEYFCKKGVCNLKEGDAKFGYCEPCSTENCPDGTCGTDGLCHKTCQTGTLCTKEGYDINREVCCTGTEICTTAGVCITPGDGCRSDLDCAVWDYCDIKPNEETGKCVPIDSDPKACYTIPEFEPIKPIIKWHYTDAVVSSPIAIDLTGDGIPEVVFTNNSYKLTAINGENGNAVAITTLTVFNKHNDIAAADVDNDGKIEVLVPSATSSSTTTGLYIMGLKQTESGTYEWEQKGFVQMNKSEFTADDSGKYWADLHPTVADIDSDGTPEIITTRGIIKGNDLTQRQCTYKMGQFATWYHYMFAVADLDQDGNMEIIANQIWDNECNVILADTSKYGYAAVADLLPDTGEPGELVPEIVRVDSANSKVAVWKVYKNGTTWTQTKIWEKSHSGTGGGNPVIADFDGDGIKEIGVAGATKFNVFKGTTGDVIWSKTIDDASSHRTGASVFDFEADGKSEVVYRDQQKIRIYNGSDGEVLWWDYSTSGTVIDYPLIVDVDGDGHTEIIVASEKKGDYHYDRLGITAYADTYGKWVPARSIWNQHSYHVTNINDDGTVPVHEEANWLKKRLNNYRANIPPAGFYNQPNFVPGQLIEDKTHCNTSPTTLGLQGFIANLGDKDIPGNIMVSIYLEGPNGEKYYIGSKTIPGLKINEKTSFIYDWDMSTAYPITNGEISTTATTLENIVNYKAVFTVDDAANTNGMVYEECDETDNTLQVSRTLVLTGC